MDTLYTIIGTMAAYHAGLIFLGLGIILILVDYFAPTNVPAHFAYFCFGAAMFFAIPGSVLSSALVALASWIVFEVLHAFFLRRFLANSPTPPGNGPS